MASTPVAINVHVLASATDLYTAGANNAQLTTLVLTNTTGSPITIDVWKRNAANSDSWFIAATLGVPANGNRSLSKALMTFENSGEKLRAQASGVGIDAVGSVIEYT